MQQCMQQIIAMLQQGVITEETTVGELLQIAQQSGGQQNGEGRGQGGMEPQRQVFGQEGMM